MIDPLYHDLFDLGTGSARASDGSVSLLDNALVGYEYFRSILTHDAASADQPALVLLRPPDWESVLGWRIEQEHALRRSRDDGIGLMDDGAVAMFVSHYERLTRHMLDEMPGRVDLALRLAGDRSCVDVRANRPRLRNA